MLRGPDDKQDQHVMEAASALVNDVIEKAREEVIKRTSVSQPRGSTTGGNVSPLRRLSQWQNRAQGAFRRFLTGLCMRIQNITK